MEALVFGLCLITSDLISLFLVIQKRPKLSLIFEVLSLVLTGVVLYFWRLLLIQNGKDPSMLGLHAYPSVTVILGVLALAAFVCLIAALVQLLLGRGKPAAK